MRDGPAARGACISLFVTFHEPHLNFNKQVHSKNLFTLQKKQDGGIGEQVSMSNQSGVPCVIETVFSKDK